MKKRIKLYWSRSKPNFGDRLSPMIVEALSGREVTYAPLGRCDLVAIGSLLQRLEEKVWTRRLHIWGTGFIEERSPRNTRHHVHAVRGVLSREIMQRPKVAVGDPGLLIDRVFGDRLKGGKRYSVAVIPHYKDKGHPGVQKLLERLPHAIEVDIFAPPMEILRIIAASDFVLASAMHGLIAADSLGIPNARIKLSEEIRGAGFKFRDYYSAFGLDGKACNVSEIDSGDITELASLWRRPGLEQLKNELEASFPVV